MTKPKVPHTLAVDIGGTGIKAATYAADGARAIDSVRVATPYPCPPDCLLDEVAALASALPPAERAGVGFPGLLRSNRVVWVNSLTRSAADGPTDDALVRQWVGFDLRSGLEDRLGIPTRVANDADVHALATVGGVGLECVLTLGTGLGFSLVDDGRLLPHLELGGAPFLDSDFEGILGQAGLERAGQDAWHANVLAAIDALRPFLYFDHLYVGGGNARLIDPASLGADVSVVSNVNGLRGGVLLWDEPRG